MSAVDGMRIAYLCLQSTKQDQASQAHVHEIINGLRSQGAHVDLFEPEYATDTLPGAVGRLMAFLRSQMRLIKVMRRYDVLYIRGHALAWPTAFWARRVSMPVVQECNGMVDDFFIAWPAARRIQRSITWLTYDQFRKADEIIVGSSGLAAWLKRETGRDGHIIPNGANCEIFQPMERPEGVVLPDEYVVFFGSLAPWQGIDTTLAAVRDPQWPEGLALVVAGDGVKRGAVEAAAAAGDGRVVYLGSLPYDQVAAIVSNAVCSLVNKEQEEFAAAGISPLKLYESMACGVPVIATEGMPGLTEVVREQEVGIIVPQRDSGALASAVARLAADAGLRAEMGQRGRAFAEAECSWFARSEDVAAVIVAAAAR
ncbi:MAG: glycosyltransferase family 4 protein [Coriobacteriia bacterium]|nr:glycosyltransferase family 4 protein [Coriobacteriia bacterium]